MSDVLSQKQKSHFAQCQAAGLPAPFEKWAEDHTAEETEQAIIEINSYVAADEVAIDETIRLNRNDYIAKQALVKRGDEVGLQFARRHPEVTMSTENMTLIIQRLNQILRSKGVLTDQAGEMYSHVTVETFETAYRQLCQEQRIDWNQAIGSPWGHREYNSEPSQASEPEREYTEDELHDMLDKGEITLEDVREAANQQLAEQNPNGTVDRSSDQIVLGRVVRPEPDAPITRERGFAALAYGKHIALKQ